MIILPEDDLELARALYDEELKNFRVVMFVFGKNPGDDQIFSKALRAAIMLPSLRRVVWIRNLDVLTEEEKKAYRIINDDGIDTAVCVLNLEDQPSVFLDREEATSFRKLALAFARAQAFSFSI